MIVLPLQLCVALLLLALAVMQYRRQQTGSLLVVLLLALATQNAVVSLAQYYGLGWARQLQPFTALVIPPLAWLAFRTHALARSEGRTITHLAVVALGAAVMGAVPMLIDPVLCLVYFGYGGALLVSLSRLRGELPLARLSAAAVPARIWAVIGAGLVLSGGSDLLISVGLAHGEAWVRVALLNAASTLVLLTIGILVFSPELAAPSPVAEAAQPMPAPTDDDRGIMERLRVLLEQEALYLDPDLNLARLSRRLSMPVKAVSTAINRETGENVSRLVNGYRIAEACRQLDSGASVTDVIYASGFNTKSNFNREFKRVTGRAPSEWRDRTDL